VTRRGGDADADPGQRPPRFRSCWERGEAFGGLVWGLVREGS